MKRRTFLRLGTAALASARIGDVGNAGAAPATLYNGIQLPGAWPPRRSLDRRVVVPPYLTQRPSVLPIDVGRQLFVDDFLIEESTLVRVWHAATPSQENPVLRPDREWERLASYTDPRKRPTIPTAMVFSDGVVYDRGRFRMWYLGGYGAGSCYADSRDGVHWSKPALDVIPGTNIVLDFSGRDSTVVWMDRLEKNPAHRYKLAMFNGQAEASGRMAMILRTSPDGVHWTEQGLTGFARDRSTVFYNPFRGVWVFSLREDLPNGVGRCRRYFEAPAFLPAPKWNKGEPLEWLCADVLDLRHPTTNVAPELYNVDCVAYESVLLGLFAIFRGDRSNQQKINELCVGFSRDGFHFTRGDRRPFIGVSEDPTAWNHGNVQSAGGCCLVVGDQLYFYASGRRGDPTDVKASSCSTGLFTLRRDGFASMAWPPDLAAPRRSNVQWLPVGTLTTRPLRFTGRYLFVNANMFYTSATDTGQLRVEVLDEDGNVIAPFDVTRCVPIQSDGVRLPVTWEGADDLTAVAGRVIRFRFAITHGHLYSFWVSKSRRGESGGYLAAGGPGVESLVDA
jgi:hypothetical protein